MEKSVQTTVAIAEDHSKSKICPIIVDSQDITDPDTVQSHLHLLGTFKLRRLPLRHDYPKAVKRR